MENLTFDTLQILGGIFLNHKHINRIYKDRKSYFRPFFQHRSAHLCGLSLFMLLTMICVGWASTEQASALYILKNSADSSADTADTASSKTKTLMLLGQNSGSSTASSQLANLFGDQLVKLSPNQSVSITHEGKTITTNARASKDETVSELLKQLHIVPSPLEMVAVDLSNDNISLTVTSDLTYYEEVTEDASFETYRVANPQMTIGEERVVQEGSNGTRTSIYEVTWSGGQELSRQFVEDVDSTVVDKIIEYGTAPIPVPEKPKTTEKTESEKTAAKSSNSSSKSQTTDSRSGIASVSKNSDGSGTLTLNDGTTLDFSSVRSMTATAYTAGYDNAGYITAIGTPLRVGEVAVDRRVIPLGTRMYIVTADGSITYGTAVAEDTGVHGNIVDLYYDTYDQCMQFGRRACTVYILK